MHTPENQLMTDHAYLGGRWVEASDGKTREVEDPATEKTIGKVPQLTEDQLGEAIDAASQAFERWRDTPALERADALMAWYQAMQDNAEALARLMTLEQGKAEGSC